jgi:hypothetical protein
MPIAQNVHAKILTPGARGYPMCGKSLSDFETEVGLIVGFCGPASRRQLGCLPQ